MTITLETAELTALLDRVTALAEPDVFGRIGLRAAGVAGERARKALEDGYPPRRSDAMSFPPSLMLQVRGKTFLSDRQRRFFFAALRSGQIQVPYPRTGQLGQSITSAPFVEGNIVGFYIGTNRPGAEYVIGRPPKQARYHQDWWTPLEDAVIEQKDMIVREFARSFFDGAQTYVNSGVLP